MVTSLDWLLEKDMSELLKKVLSFCEKELEKLNNNAVDTVFNNVEFDLEPINNRVLESRLRLIRTSDFGSILLVEEECSLSGGTEIEVLGGEKIGWKRNIHFEESLKKLLEEG